MPMILPVTKFLKLDNVLLLLAVCFAVGSGVVYARSSQVTIPPQAKHETMLTGLTERDKAISEAQSHGQTTYSYSTHFVPGIGYPNTK